MFRSALGVLAIVLALTPQFEIRAQEKKSGANSAPAQFTALDYIQIQQLVALYAQYIDTCSNNGYDYADLFAADGYFAPFTNGRVGGKWQGRERLAEASGGGRLGLQERRLDQARRASHVRQPHHQADTRGRDRARSTC